MTKISYIHGQIPTDERAQRAKEIGPKRFLTPLGLSDGQFASMLLHRQLNILASYYPEMRDYKVAKQAVESALGTGLHSADIKSGGSDFIRRVNQKLETLKMQRRSSIAGPESSRLSQELVEHYLAGNTGNYYNLDSHFKTRCVEAYNMAHGTNYNRYKTKHLSYCSDLIRIIGEMNEGIDSSSHHMLYEFAQGSKPAAVTTKKVLHQNAVGSFGNIIQVTRSNMSQWVRTGVMAKNAEVGAEPLQPEETVELVGQQWKNDNSAINAIPAAVAIIGAITSAIGATAALVNSLGAAKAQQLRSQVQGIGLGTFGPQQSDWPGMPGGPGTGGEGTGNSLLPIILGGAGLYLLTQK